MTLILLVEDDEDNAKLLLAILNHYGVTVERVDCAELGLEFCKKNNPTLIITDINLPKMGGVEFQKSLRKMPAYAKTPIIAVTGSIIITGKSMPGLKEQFLNEGFTDHVAKPYNVLEVLTVLKKYISIPGT